jgi:fermentation-respiration switch protein FrsA (DUF1100 family)
MVGQCLGSAARGRGNIVPACRSVVSVVALRHPVVWQGSRKRRLARLAAFGFYAYVGVLVVLLILENRFLFRPIVHTEEWHDPPAGLVVEDVELTSADGTRLHAWWSAPPGWEPSRGAMLYCHGNAGNLSGRGETLLRWQQRLGYATLIFDYPGFGRSGGRPSEAGCYAAGDAAYEWLTGVKKVRPRDLVLYGGSLGGGIATDLAWRRPFRALVLVAAFTSFPDMAQKTVPWFPARWLVRNQFDNLRKIATVRGPVFIAHGTADALVPFTQGERLFAAAAGPKAFFPMPGHGHNNTPGPDFYEAVRDFLAKTGSGS